MSEIRPDADGNFPHLCDGTDTFRGRVATGHGSAYMVTMFVTDHMQLFVGVEGLGCWTFHVDGFVSADYVAEKIRGLGGDAANIADLIQDQGPYALCDRQGRYLASCCQAAQQDEVGT